MKPIEPLDPDDMRALIARIRAQMMIAYLAARHRYAELAGEPDRTKPD